MSPEMTYIYTVYREGSFSKAAEKLFMTQPALSIAVRKVEDSIGMPIFDRKRKPLQLTEAGVIYMETVRKMMLLEKEQQQKLMDIQHIVSGTVRLGGTHFFNAYILPQILAGFTREYPNVELQIMERSSFELGQMLSSRELDLTFQCGPEHIKNYHHHFMFEDHVLLAVPAKNPFNDIHKDHSLTAQDILDRRHIQENCPRLPVSALQEPELILLRKGNNLHERVLEMFRIAEITPRVKMDVNQLVTAFHLAEAGIASTFISDRVVQRENPDLMFYALDTPMAARDFYILLSKDAYIPIAVRKLVEYILSSMEQAPNP